AAGSHLMSRRIGIVVVSFLAGLAVAALVPDLSQVVRKTIGVEAERVPRAGGDQRDAESKQSVDSGALKLTPDQIAAAGIDVAAVGSGTLARRAPSGIACRLRQAHRGGQREMGKSNSGRQPPTRL